MKILFVHIPKAAGSSVNKFVMNFFDTGRAMTHLESEADWRDENKRNAILNNNDYISGHLPLREFIKRIQSNEFKIFSIIRDPRTHIVSHLSWIRRLADPEHKDSFSKHPKYIQKLAKKLSTINLGSSNELHYFVESLSSEEFALLDNSQVRYLRMTPNLGSVNEFDLLSSVISTYKIDYIGRMEDMSSCFKSLQTLLGRQVFDFDVHINVSNETYGLNPNDSDQIKALWSLIKYDMKLYDNARFYLPSEINMSPVKLNCNHDFSCFIDVATTNVIAGWINDNFLDTPVSFDILINDNIVAHSIANLYRPDLNKIFKKNCAFHFIFPAYLKVKVGDRVAINVLGAYELNSTFII